MTSCLTVWTSGSTRHAESHVAQAIGALKDRKSEYDSLSVAGCLPEETEKRINEAFDRLINMTMVDSTLHIIAVVPLYEEDSVRQIKDLCDVCERNKHNLTLHVLGLCEDIGRLFDIRKDEKTQDYQKGAMDYLSNLGKTSSMVLSYTLIDEYAANGAPIGFEINSLAHYIALIHLALMQDYYAILSPALLSAHQGQNLTIGVSSLSFDREATASQLLGLGFLSALDNAGINDAEVDLQKATHEAENLLTGIGSRYQNLYEKSIRPLYKEGMDENKVVAKATPIIEENLKNLKTELLEFLNHKELSFPEKEGVLAMILGRDNEKLRGVQYDHKGIILEDGCSEVIDLYVEAFNKYCDDKKLLPVRGDFEFLRVSGQGDENVVETKEYPENETAFNPLQEIKKLKQEILNITSYIREKNDELEILKNSESTREKAQEIRKHWNKPKGILRDAKYKEQPLKEKYFPAPSLEVKKTVDLRRFFSPARNQHKIGSCTSFAVASMYEAMMRRVGLHDVETMSPAFLYYYSNVVKGRPEGGSNYFEQLEILSEQGLCRESLYRYDAEKRMEEPNEEAKKDAQVHKLVKAVQIPIVKDKNKSVSLKANHKAFTSALSEGYPIGISLLVYDNLGKNGPFVLHPQDTRDAKEEGWHAMVVVGYSEDKGFYIVRNSWGPEFGDEGYCYVPSAYIDDPEYNDFACIITEISENAQSVEPEIPTELANFAATETEIKGAAIRNAVSKIRVELSDKKKQYSDYYQYYQRLMQHLAIPSVQKKIRSSAEEAQALYYLRIDAQRKQLEDSFVKKIKEYKNGLTKTILWFFITFIGFGVGWFFSKLTWAGIVALCFGGLGVLIWSGYKWWVRQMKKRLQDELDEMAVESKRQRQNLFEMQMKYHVAGIWISKFHKLALELDTIYDRLVSYNDVLREWQKDYENGIGQIEKPEGQMFRHIDASPLLDNYFRANKESIVNRIDLLKLFDEYQINTDQLGIYHENLRGYVREAISAMMGEFNLTNYLMGDKYDFLPESDVEKEITVLLAVGQPAFRNKSRSATAPVRIVLANVEPSRFSEWEQKVYSYFPLRPIHLQNNNTQTLIILTIHPVATESSEEG